MNTTSHLLAGLVVGSALLVGCEERPEARPAPERTTPTVPSTTTPSTTDTTMPGTATNQDAQSRAQTLILQFHRQVDSGDYTAAEQTLQQLEGMRANLPRATQDQIDDLRDTLRQRQGGTTPGTSPGSTEPATPPGS